MQSKLVTSKKKWPKKATSSKETKKKQQQPNNYYRSRYKQKPLLARARNQYHQWH